MLHLNQAALVLTGEPESGLHSRSDNDLGDPWCKGLLLHNGRQRRLVVDRGELFSPLLAQVCELDRPKSKEWLELNAQRHLYNRGVVVVR